MLREAAYSVRMAGYNSKAVIIKRLSINGGATAAEPNVPTQNLPCRGHSVFVADIIRLSGTRCRLTVFLVLLLTNLI